MNTKPTINEQEYPRVLTKSSGGGMIPFIRDPDAWLENMMKQMMKNPPPPQKAGMRVVDNKCPDYFQMLLRGMPDKSKDKEAYFRFIFALPYIANWALVVSGYLGQDHGDDTCNYHTQKPLDDKTANAFKNIANVTRDGVNYRNHILSLTVEQYMEVVISKKTELVNFVLDPKTKLGTFLEKVRANKTMDDKQVSDWEVIEPKMQIEGTNMLARYLIDYILKNNIKDTITKR